MPVSREFQVGSAAGGGLQALVAEVAAGATESVRDATSLPPQAYVAQPFFDLERERIFKRGWLCVGHVSQVPEVGDYFTLELLREPLIVVRGKDRIRVLSSVCRHRWAPVAQGTGNTSAFSCPFHKWTYALDGHLIGAPLMEQAAHFDKKNCRLPEFRSEVVADLGLIFVTFAPDIPPISEQLADLCARVRAEGWEDLKQQVVARALHQSNDYNWKVQVETYAECYHHIGGHLTTLQQLLPAQLTSCEPDNGRWCVCHVRVTTDVDKLNVEERQAFESFAPGAKPGDVVGHIVVIYPFTLVTFMHGSCDLRVLDPIDPSHTRSVILTTMSPAKLREPGYAEWAKQFFATADVVNKEDNDINDMQQRGVTSHRAEAGRLSHLEACAWYLAQYVRRQLSGG